MLLHSLNDIFILDKPFDQESSLLTSSWFYDERLLL